MLPKINQHKSRAGRSNLAIFVTFFYILFLSYSGFNVVLNFILQAVPIRLLGFMFNYCRIPPPLGSLKPTKG